VADKYLLKTHPFKLGVSVCDLSCKRENLQGHCFVVQVNQYALVSWDFEGLEGVFFVPVWAGLNEEMHGLIQRHVQKKFTLECEEWRELYGCAE